MVPVGQRIERVRQLSENGRQALILPEFLARIGLVIEIIREKCASPGGEIAE